jgi:glycosyltransferase involved in cell wall biosynthesis
LADHGAEVTLVTSRASGQARRTVSDGIAIDRGGGRFGVYVFVLLWLLRRRPMRLLGRRAQVDAVLDCQNGIPFFSSLAVGRRVPVVLLIHHVHQEQFAQHFGKRLAGVGRFLEGPASRVIYAHRPTICVSPSTRAEVRRSLRFRTPIYVVPNGGPGALRGGRRPSAAPSVVTVGRLVVQKQVDDLLVAVAHARRAVPELVFHVVGDGPELGRLRGQAEALGLGSAVVFHGRVADAERDALLDRAWIFLSASHREGWGVAVLEAAARGVPALARDVPGLRDAVRPGVTGWLLDAEASLGDGLVAAIAALRDPQARTLMAENCYDWAENFSWDRSARRVSGILEHEALRIQARRPLRRVPDLVTRVELELPGATGVDPELPTGANPALATAADSALPVRADLAVPPGGRLTDEWRRTEGQLVGLLYGTDEQGAHQALVRLSLDRVADVRVARSQDLLGEPPRHDRRGVAVMAGTAGPMQRRLNDARA